MVLADTATTAALVNTSKQFGTHCFVDVDTPRHTPTEGPAQLQNKTNKEKKQRLQKVKHCNKVPISLTLTK